MQSDKAGLQNDKEDLKYEKSDLINENSNIKSDLDNLSASSTLTIAEQEKRLKNLENLIQTQKATLNNLKKSIGDALTNYKADELTVYVKDGNLYVSLEEKLLFKSGSDVVDPKGKLALSKLANVIKNTKDITVMIEGHTDNVPIKSKQFKNNWELSTARALSIVQILTKDYGFDAQRVIASGRGEFHPIKKNNTVAGKARNRRTEIILTPNLTDLYKLLN